jgi:hypothetical protein
MFATVEGMEASVAALHLAGARSRPVTRAETRLVEVPAPLAVLFPEGGIRKGVTVAVDPLSGGCSLALALAASVTGTGGWVAAVGLPSLGLVAASDLGVDLRRLALVPAPGEQWAAALAALVDGFDLLLVRPSGRPRPVEARRLAARVRERGAVMLVLDAPRWPEPPDLRLSVSTPVWEGLGAGYGRLIGRRLEVVAGGRRLGGRERRRSVWLPSPSGGVAEVVVGGGAAWGAANPATEEPAVAPIAVVGTAG